jgi:hypothetical protein
MPFWLIFTRRSLFECERAGRADRMNREGRLVKSAMLGEPSSMIVAPDNKTSPTHHPRWRGFFATSHF